ncbi:16S rRNA (guanine(966)-N(2))-methyltransferase RsmD [Facklamia lactis]|uniref:16S rRNA (guanine(966)-N(2))-methyltransferase RsmD n=1 Tax=Facklamia lactis TaxID=2749967 RepID=UPI002E2955F5|nr:16S rRNA (guanine(966)-N(2))-methyltransferase RsmD [Facklamia lactis]
MAGEYRSRPIKAVPGKNTRPTTDKIKESMFNLLGSYLPVGGRVLDFYAGSGALAIEAVSRGVGQAILCEQYRPAIETIEENIRMTREEAKFILLRGKNRSRLKRWYEQCQLRFDLVFLDPPYHSAQLQEDMVWLKEQGLLTDEALVLCESDDHLELPGEFEEFYLLKQKSYGITTLRLYQYKGVE